MNKRQKKKFEKKMCVKKYSNIVIKTCIESIKAIDRLFGHGPNEMNKSNIKGV